MLGLWVITLAPIFSGLARSFISGIFASTLFTLVVVPLLHFTIYGIAGGKKETAFPESFERGMGDPSEAWLKKGGGAPWT